MSLKFDRIVDYDPSILMIVDSLNLAFRYKHKKQVFYKDDYIRTVKSLRKSYKAKYVIITGDHGKSTFRKEIYPEYKGDREAKRAIQTPEEEQEFLHFLEEYRLTLEKILEEGEFPVLRFKGVEADDIAAYICKFAKQYGIKKIVLISSDKDWDLLINEDTIRFSYVTTKETTLENFEDHHKCLPHQFLTVKCLMGGDDNITGVFKVGPAYARKLYEKYGDIFDISAALPIDSKYVYIKNLNAFGSENLLRNCMLYDLDTYCVEAIGEDNCKEIDNTLELYLNVKN